ncbi:MAG: hypothetical protein U0525_00910 [Patescibacteria group bacterium]
MTTVTLSCEGNCALHGLFNRNLRGDTLQGDGVCALRNGIDVDGHKCRQVEAGRSVSSVTAQGVEGCLFQATYKVGS